MQVMVMEAYAYGALIVSGTNDFNYKWNWPSSDQNIKIIITETSTEIRNTTRPNLMPQNYLLAI